MEIFYVSLVIGVFLIMLYIIINLLRKVEKLEDTTKTQDDILIGYQAYLNKISGIIDYSAQKLKDLDSRGVFKSDDEIGFFFEGVKDIQTTLNEFNINTLDE
jgi:hypothetical protein